MIFYVKSQKLQEGHDLNHQKQNKKETRKIKRKLKKAWYSFNKTSLITSLIV